MLHWNHYSKTEEATVPDDQGARDRFAERDLNMPEPLLWKTRPWRKRLHTLTI
jgi:hypothetical protein